MQKQRYWIYRRSGVFYLHDSKTGKRESLHTRSRREAEQTRIARNEAVANPRVGLAMAKAILSTHDPEMPRRTWEDVFNEFSNRGKPQTQTYRRRVLARKPFDAIRDRKLIETTADNFIQLLKTSGAQVHHNLRCLQNLAVGFGWPPWPILPPKLWPTIERRPKRAITLAEYVKIIAAERNKQRQFYYQLLWETGASQGDGALLCAENVDWQERILAYRFDAATHCTA